jgi:hypothetical protein
MRLASYYFFCVSLLFAIPNAFGDVQVPKLIQESGAWRAYSMKEGRKNVCFASSKPKREEGKYKRRGDVFVLITHRPALNSYDVVSFDAGYTFKKNQKVTVNIGKRNFTLFSEGETAWATDPKTDKSITNAIAQGSEMIVQGVSSRGTKTRDVYSLKGSLAALQAIKKACKVK